MNKQEVKVTFNDWFEAWQKSRPNLAIYAGISEEAKMTIGALEAEVAALHPALAIDPKRQPSEATKALWRAMARHDRRRTP